jgi:glycosyltransferase involved in cell wall biosynthesis
MTIDIILLTCNRVDNSRETIDQLHKRIKVPFRLIVIDDESVDGTQEYLKEQVELGRVDVFSSLKNSNICQAYNKGFEYVESDYFFCMQDDITVPDLDLCVTTQLIELLEKYPENASIGCRIQRIPNLDWSAGNEDIVPARKAASAYFRVHRKSDVEKLGKEPFGNKSWDDMAWVSQVRNVLKMEASWAKNLWADHSRGYCPERGYHVKPRKWGTGIHSRLEQEIARKPYPKIDLKTNKPLPGEKIYR